MSFDIRDHRDHRDFDRTDTHAWWLELMIEPPPPGHAAVLETGGGVWRSSIADLATWLRSNGLSPTARRVEATIVLPGEFLVLFLGEPVRIRTLTRPRDDEEAPPRGHVSLAALGCAMGIRP